MDPSEILLTLFQNFANLVPRRTVYEWDQAFLTRRGQIIHFIQRTYEDGRVKAVRQFRKSFYWPWESKSKNAGNVEILPPGAYWFVPFIENIDVHAVSECVIDTERQDCETKDGKIVSVSGTVTYGISSLPKYYRNLQDHAPSIRNVAERAIATVIEQSDYEDLQTQRTRKNGDKKSELEKRLLDTGRELCTGYGIDIRSIGFVNFAAAETYRLIGNQKGHNGDGTNNIY